MGVIRGTTLFAVTVVLNAYRNKTSPSVQTTYLHGSNKKKAFLLYPPHRTILIIPFPFVSFGVRHKRFILLNIIHSPDTSTLLLKAAPELSQHGRPALPLFLDDLLLRVAEAAQLLARWRLREPAEA